MMPTTLSSPEAPEPWAFAATRNADKAAATKARPRALHTDCVFPIELMAKVTESLDVQTIRAIEEGVYGGKAVPLLWSHLAKPMMAAIGSALPRPHLSFSQLCQRGVPPQTLEALSPLARFEATRALSLGAQDTRLYRQLEYTWDMMRELAYRLVGQTPVLVTGILADRTQASLRDQLRATQKELNGMRPVAVIRDVEHGSSCVVMLDSFLNYLDSVLAHELNGNVIGALFGMTTSFGNYFR